jgi:integrase
LGLEIKHISDDFIAIRQSVWSGSVQFPKTPNSIRDVDLPASLAAMLRKFIGGRTSGFLFQTKASRSISQSDILTRALHPILEAACLEKRCFHAFRRFRTTWLRKNRVPEDLVRFWIGHSNRTVTDGYSKVKEDAEFRKKVCGEVGLGFQLPTEIRAENTEVAPSCTQNSVEECAV